ncbi:hypothetical protein ACT9N5_16855 [Edwardsiella piscicida]|uniref:Uncharacterized protein n=2 Tax=Edwardsiella piscicida TaxID=1263550 RepID=A0AAQ3H4I2_EDWPI|nr:hypothetical protein [Edwardsiella piscicida]MDM3866533.1 hypothetical protein [Edwardsiella piscicida]QHR95282.1 hypothetical protein GT752_08395 [Edwardsiella piscicida]UJT82104.1 hypothetical protein L1P07_14680 [Edwardsiella piscicida]UJT85368.1 hypothetical protein L1P05_14640 [Edwardsiella piscicida]WDU90637.1 hypothetical protein PWJ79_14645 [Edwardsiella piscicida]
MPVKFYAFGEHPTGFVGYRVHVSVAGKDRQKYFSTNKYPPDLAKKLAYEMDQSWKAEAEEAKRSGWSKNVFTPRHGERPSLIVKNFHVKLTHQRKLDNKAGGAVKSAYTFPEFIVTYCARRNGRNLQTSKHYRIDKLGLTEAFQKACAFYAEIYQLDDAQRQELDSLKPSLELFTGILYQQLCQKFGQEKIPSPEEILAMLRQ